MRFIIPLLFFVFLSPILIHCSSPCNSTLAQTFSDKWNDYNQCINSPSFQNLPIPLCNCSNLYLDAQLSYSSLTNDCNVTNEEDIAALSSSIKQSLSSFYWVLSSDIDVLCTSCLGPYSQLLTSLSNWTCDTTIGTQYIDLVYAQFYCGQYFGDYMSSVLSATAIHQLFQNVSDYRDYECAFILCGETTINQLTDILSDCTQLDTDQCSSTCNVTSSISTVLQKNFCGQSINTFVNQYLQPVYQRTNDIAGVCNPDFSVCLSSSNQFNGLVDNLQDCFSSSQNGCIRCTSFLNQTQNSYVLLNSSCLQLTDDLQVIYSAQHLNSDQITTYNQIKQYCLSLSATTTTSTASSTTTGSTGSTTSFSSTTTTSTSSHSVHNHSTTTTGNHNNNYPINSITTSTSSTTSNQATSSSFGSVSSVTTGSLTSSTSSSTSANSATSATTSSATSSSTSSSTSSITTGTTLTDETQGTTTGNGTSTSTAVSTISTSSGSTIIISPGNLSNSSHSSSEKRETLNFWLALLLFISALIL